MIIVYLRILYCLIEINWKVPHPPMPLLDTTKYKQNWNKKESNELVYIGSILSYFTPGPCYKNPCQNDGVCEENGDEFKCVCSDEFQGQLCEKKKGNEICTFD